MRLQGTGREKSHRLRAGSHGIVWVKEAERRLDTDHEGDQGSWRLPDFHREGPVLCLQSFPCISPISILPLLYFSLTWLFPEKAAFPCSQINPDLATELWCHLCKGFHDSTMWRKRLPAPSALCPPSRLTVIISEVCLPSSLGTGLL